MAKRGRKPNPPRPEKDEGTTELQRKRMFISPKDTTLSTCPLDAMRAKDIISPEAHNAAGHFLALRKLVFGKATPGAIDLLAVSGRSPDELDEKDAIKAERNYRSACTAVKRFGGKTFAATEDVLVYQQWPEWLSLRNSSHWHRRLVLLGIAALLGWHEGVKRDGA